MTRTFAGFEFEEKEVKLSDIVDSDTQPSDRNRMDADKRQGLAKDIEKNGLKDRVDLVPIKDGKFSFEVIEGHGRILVALSLGWETIPAKVYKAATETERIALRAALFNANATILSMSGPQWTEYYYLNLRKNHVVEGAPRAAVNLVNFLVTSFTTSETEEYIFRKGVGPAQLSSARGASRELLGLSFAGKFPETSDAKEMLKRSFRWVVKHGMSRAVIEWRASRKGAATLRRCIDNDRPLPYGH